MGDFRLNDSLVANLSVWASDAKPTAREVEALAREVQESRTEIKAQQAEIERLRAQEQDLRMYAKQDACEIERLRAAGDALHKALNDNIMWSGLDQINAAWEEARREQ